MTIRLFRNTLVNVILLCVVACSPAQDTVSTIPADPVTLSEPEPFTSAERAAIDVVARRTAAYNAHDIEAFLATYDENVRVYEYPDDLLGEGKDRMRRIFGPQFAENDGSIVVHSRHALEKVVVNYETVKFFGKTAQNIGVYTIAEGLIVEVRLIEPD